MQFCHSWIFRGVKSRILIGVLAQFCHSRIFHGVKLRILIEVYIYEIKNLLGKEDKDTHYKDMGEILRSKEEELRKSKERKLRRDRKLHKERRRNIPGSKSNFAQIATMHIKKKLETTKLRSRKVEPQENSSDSEEEKDSRQPYRRRGTRNSKEKHHFCRGNKESTKGEEQENPTL